MTENKETDNDFTADLAEFTETLERLIEAMNVMKADWDLDTLEDVIGYINDNTTEE